MDTSSLQKKKQEQVGSGVAKRHLYHQFSFKIYRTMFDYSLSIPRCQPTAPWSSERHKNRRQLIIYPFLMECNYTTEVVSNLKRKRIDY
jgi:hypothetical protein